ncbi:major facilitator superfamily domain-containing protein 6 [Parasteatoda tepidariorum]|uniref:major facilitator superfamily domain-containing protein 6 n=1 Tax=Parasteatoda tepidariorum TaxID=114398 RepID=UPI001C7191C6|nr:major facilitator superfamily domain-containing protein 6-like [Parasteatoda tepidariorum]XP_042910601.1 major facilitator superfamily domain-containing protein 6-like [Parasteatoda tepidariorum]
MCTVLAVKTPKDKTEGNAEKKSFFHIDKEMLRFKIHFFLFIGGTASVNPFIPVVAKNRLGLSATSLAAVLAAKQLITIASKPIIGYIADYFNRLKLMINTLLILQIVFLFLILAVPPIKKPSNSSQELTLYDQIENSKKLSESVILSTRYHPNSKTSSVEITSPNSPEKDGDLWNEDNSPFSEIISVQQINYTAMICFQKKLDAEISNFYLESELNCSCLVYSFSADNLNEHFQQYNKKLYFRLQSLDSNYSDYQTNKTFPCTIMLTKDNDNSTISTINDFHTFEFWIFAAFYILAGICTSSVFTLSDTACCESVQKLGGEFGRQRLFGAVGWGALAAISGYLCDLTGNFYASWTFMAVLQILALWNVSQLYLTKPHFSQNLLKDVGRVLKSVEFVAFEFGVLFNGISAGLLWSYLIWFVSSLGASKFLCGLTQYVECFLGEIPFMFFSGWFIKKLGHFNLLSLSLISYALRFLWYSYLQNPWLVLPAEITHGFTYGTLFPAIASYGKMKAKPGTEATTQSILFTTHGGLGAGLGCILAGICFDKIGPHQTFFYFSIMCSCASVLNIVHTFLFKCHNTDKLSLSSGSIAK